MKSWDQFHKETIMMIDSFMKYHEPQMNADKRRFVISVFSSSLVLIDANQQNNHFFAPFASFAVKNSANNSKPALALPPNVFDDILNVKRE